MTKPSIVQRSSRQLERMIDLSQADAPSRGSLGAHFWKSATPVWPSRNRRLARLRLDPEVLDWFGSLREDERVGVNAVLRAYVERRKSEK